MKEREKRETVKDIENESETRQETKKRNTHRKR